MPIRAIGRAGSLRLLDARSPAAAPDFAFHIEGDRGYSRQDAVEVLETLTDGVFQVSGTGRCADSRPSAARWPSTRR